MNVLVTGGAGFIGSHLCDALIESGHRVVALDDLSTGSRDNLIQLSSHQRFRLLEGDVREPRHIDQAADLLAELSGEGTGPDTVFHLAAAVGVKAILDRPLHSLDTNVHGAENVLR